MKPVSQKTLQDVEHRATERQKRMVTHRAHSHEESEKWDLKFWQDQGAEARLSALVSLRESLAKVEAARRDA